MNQNVTTSHQLLLTIFVLILCGLFGASHTNTIRAKLQISTDGNFTEVNKRETAADNTNNEEGDLLVKILKSLGADLTDNVEYGDHELVVSLLSEIKAVWRSIVNNSISLVNSGETAQSLKMYMAHILFLANDRHCESPDETFFKGQCLLVSTTSRSEHCPENMGLYDNENNEGICDCLELTGEQAKSQLRPIYSDETGVCHRQNTQGPCENGQWFVLKNTSQCEPVPEGCPTDGLHVSWSSDPSMAKQCWKIWTQGPCEKGQLLHLAQDSEEILVYCSYQLAEYSSSNSQSYYPPCPAGTYRNLYGRCTKPGVG